MKGMNLKKGGDYWQIWGFPLFGGDRYQVLDRISNRLELVSSGLEGKRGGRRPMWIATVNPEFVMEAMKDSGFKKILCEKTDLNVMDGIGLIWAREVLGPNLQSKNNLLRGLRVGVEVILGKYRQKVVTGSDLMLEMCRLAKSKNYRVFFLGGWGDGAVKTGRNIQCLLSGSDVKPGKRLQIAWSPGQPKIKNTDVLAKINKFKPDILLVAYGMKRQEEWIEKNLSKLKVKVVMGVGRSFDYYGGDLKRAPKIWRSRGLEWLYSLIKEPKRWRRQLVLPKFAWKVIKQGCLVK